MEVLLAVIAIVGFIGILPQFWGSSWKDIYRFGCKGTVPWDMVHEASLRLLAKMREEGFRPTVVAGIGRGGILAAGLVSSEITRGKLISDGREPDRAPELPPLRIATINTNVVFKLQGSPGSGMESQRALVDRIDLQEIDCTVRSEDKVVLLVSQNFTGATLEKAVAFVVSRGVARENVKTATLFWQKPKGMEQHHFADAHEPDLFGMVIGASKTMPWKSKQASTDRM